MAFPPCHLALDLSSTTLGWCASHGGVWTWGEETLPGKTLDERLGAFYLWLKHRIPMSALIIEQPFVKHRSAVAALYGVAGIARGMAAAGDCAVVLLSPSDVKRHWTGKAHATKEEMERPWPMRTGGHPFPGEHAIDACAAMSCFETRDYKVPAKKKRKTKARRA